jgi:hypothetical protein
MNLGIRRLPLGFFTFTLPLALGFGCAGGTYRVHSSAPLRSDARWALLPVVNLTETPLAGEKVEAILAALLRTHDVSRLESYPQPAQEDDALPDLNERHRLEAATAWAKTHGFDYGVTGAVSEWRYKTGLDGEPAVGVMIEILELSTGQVVFSASGASTGWGRESLSGTGQQVVDRLLSELRVR